MSDNDNDQYSEEQEQEILDLAKERYEAALEHYEEFNQTASDILRFVLGDQWDEDAASNRKSKKLPVLTTNMVDTFVRHITGENRQNTPSIQVDPKDDDATQETAEAFADLIRGIEQQSDASTAYDVGTKYATITGLGYVRVTSEFEENSFDQKLVINTVDDPQTILLDPMHRKLDGSDSEYAFVITKLTKQEYNRQFQHSRLKEIINQVEFSTDNPGTTSRWLKENEIIIAEYYWKEWKKSTLYKVFDAATQETYTTPEKPSKDELNMGLKFIIDQRENNTCIIKWTKINDEEILESTTWPGKNIPIVAIKCQELWVDGKRKLKGMVEDARDSQIALNYFTSVQAELTMMAPRAPWVMTAKQLQGYEDEYNNANSSAINVLKYNADPIAQGAPTRQSVEVPIQASMAQCTQAKDNIKMIFGIQDASLGVPGNEISGAAIIARQQSAHTANYHIYDNLTKAIAQIGNILIDTIPVFYGNERIVQVIKKNKEAATMSINGENDSHNLTRGGYGVVVETGPSYATKRQEAVNEMITFSAGLSEAQKALTPDLIARNADWPGAKELANRLALTLPPAIQQAEAASQDGTNPKQQLQQAIQQVQQLQSELTQANQVIQQGHQHVINIEEENKMLKQKTQIEVMKAKSDNEIKNKQLILDELTTELEYKIRMKELEQTQQEIELKKEQLALSGVEVAHTMNNDHHDREVAHIERMATPDTDISDASRELTKEELN